MLAGFIGASLSPAHSRLGFSRTSFIRGCNCARRRPSRTSRSSSRPTAAPCMLAKYQKQDENSQSRLDNETELEKIVAPPALPTLTTLSNSQADSPAEIDLSRLSDMPMDPESLEKAKRDKVLASMGVGLSAEMEGSVINFLRGVYEEFKIIEWPSAGRVIKVTMFIIVTLAVAIVSLYFIDGFFYRMSQIYFEGA